MNVTQVQIQPSGTVRQSCCRASFGAPLKLPLRPGSCVLRQPMFIVNDAHLVRRVWRPSPEDNVDVCNVAAGREAWNDDRRYTVGHQATRNVPTRRQFALRGKVLPRAGQIGPAYAVKVQNIRLGQVQNVLAIDLVAAHHHRLRFEREPLLSFKPSRLDPH